MTIVHNVAHLSPMMICLAILGITKSLLCFLAILVEEEKIMRELKMGKLGANVGLGKAHVTKPKLDPQNPHKVAEN